MRKRIGCTHLFLCLLLAIGCLPAMAQDDLVAEMHGAYDTGTEFNLWISSQSGSIRIDYGNGTPVQRTVSTDPRTPTKVNNYVTRGKPVKIYGTDLSALRCFWNDLTSLTIQAPELEVLHCHTNRIASLDLTRCPKLRVLDATDAGISMLNISGLTAIDTLVCDDNSIEALDLKGMTRLSLLECYSNRLRELDLRDCSSLVKLSAHKNQLASLNVSGLAKLESLSCWRNQISEIDLSAASQLNTLDCSENLLSLLLVSPMAPLAKIELYDNRLDASAFDAFISSLPDLSGKEAGTLKAVKTDASSPEGNRIDRNAYRAAQAKNWKIYQGYDELPEPEAFAYPADSYQLSEDGSTLVKWLGEETEIDMNLDERLARVTEIGREAFSGNRDIVRVVLPDGATNIGFEAFRDCNMLQTVSWGDALNQIEDGAFSACKALQSVDFKQVGKIGQNSFSGCRALTALFIPEALSEMGYAPFVGCTRLASVEVAPKNDWYTSIDGVLLDKTCNFLWLYPPARTGTEYEIPASVSVVAGRAFDNCKKIETLHIGGRVTAMGKNALFNCTGLKLITIRALTPPEMQGDAPLNGINTETCVLKVYPEARQAYAEAPVWSEFSNIQDLARPKGISPDSYVLSADGKRLIKWLGNETEIDMTADARLNGVEVIETDAFTVTSMFGDESSNMSLLSLTLSEQMKTLRETALWCTEMTSLTLNEGLETIEEAAISGLKIPRLTIPASVSRIDCNGLFNCFHLEQITVNDRNKRYYAPDGLLADKTNGTLLLYPLGRKETSAVLPAGIKRIGRGAFFTNQSLESITLPEGLTTVDSLAFFICSALKRVDMPATLSHVAARAFNSNESLDRVIVRNSRIPEIAPYQEYRGVFHRISDQAVLYVPDDAVEAYKNCKDWSGYFADVQPISILGAAQPAQPDGAIRAECRDGRIIITRTGAPVRITLFKADGTIIYTGRADGTVVIPAEPQTVYLLQQGSEQTVQKIITATP